MEVACIGVDPSVDTIAPPARFVEVLDAFDVEVRPVDGTTSSLEPCDAVVTFTHDDAFLETVDWVHAAVAGVDAFPREAYAAAGVALTNSSGIHGPAVGETVASYLLAFRRRLHRHVAHQQRREWRQPDWDEAATLAGDTVCVVGLGSLGRGVAATAGALGCRVVGVRRSGEPVEGVERVYGPDDLHEAVADAHFVVLAVPLDETTRHLVDADLLAAMRDDAYLVNVARGEVVDQPALVAALEAGDLAGAALDVFETEPLPAESPLWGMDEVIVSPHCAGFTVDYRRNVAALVGESLERLRSGGELVNRVV